MPSPCIVFFILCVFIIASTSALTFDCKFVEAPWMAIGLNYQCQTQPFNVESTQYLTNVSGIHIDNKTNHDVIAIHISNCFDLSYIPKGLLRIFPNLIGIYLHGCGIVSLSGTELNEYPRLKLFALESSPLFYVPGDFFAQNPDMLLISFVENKINATGRNLLSNLNKLSEVYFESNICIDKNATTMEEIQEFNEQLNRDCSSASEMFKSVSAKLIFSGVVFLGKFNWIN